MKFKEFSKKRNNSKKIFHVSKLLTLIVCLIMSVSACSQPQQSSTVAESQATGISFESPSKEKTGDYVEPEPEREAEAESESEAESEPEAKSESNAKAESEPAPVQPKECNIVMVGDVLLHTPVEKSALREDLSYNYDALFSHTKETISSADLALVNQEVIIAGADLGISGYPCFNADFSLCNTLVETGFDVICHATNHALDKGKTGLLACADYWEENYPQIEVLGIHKQPVSPTIVELDDMKIAILNYTYGTNGIPLPQDMPYAVDLLDKEKVIEDIRLAEKLADFTIVCPHWGTEYRLTPDASQEKWTKIFAENGVDLILGTHPHVIEPIEWVTDENTGHEMLVYYSLGNYVNWTSSTGAGVANRMVGGLAQITLSKDETGKVQITDYGVKALVSHVESGQDGVTTYFLSDYTEEKESCNEIINQDSNFSKEYCINLCNQVWGNLWE